MPTNFNQINRGIASVMTDYVSWVIEEAQKKNIKTLYFLARDGYLLRDIAQMMCKNLHLNLECRYFYCSRMSLRMPSYHLIGDEAYDLLFLGGYHVMLKSFLERAEIPQEYYQTILREAGFPADVSLDAEIPNAEIPAYRSKILKSKTYMQLLTENSKEAYQTTIGYFKQEKMFEQKHIAIVDSGWTGSMQRSIRQLLESGGFCGSVTGFYFGMYADPKDPADGEYLPWYFSQNKEKKNKILFCNNLFECFLSAPHGMTLRYACKDGEYVPVLAEEAGQKHIKFVKEQIDAYRGAAQELMEKHQYQSDKKQAQKILRRIMGKPTEQEAGYFGQYQFCDDVTETYHFSLADQQQIDCIKNYAILPRVLRKVTRKSQDFQMTELFWPYGTISFMKSGIRRWWYRTNVYIWEWLKYTLK